MSFNLANKQFGDWIVQPVSETRGSNQYWLCKCRCGVERFVRSSELIAGRSSSCGGKHIVQRNKFKTKQEQKRSETVRVDYRYYSPTRKRFDRWDYFGRMPREQADKLLRKNNRNIEYRIYEKPERRNSSQSYQVVHGVSAQRSAESSD